MSTMRGISLGLIAVILILGLGVAWVNQQKTQRIQDYANLMTETHRRAIEIFDEAEAQNQVFAQQLASGGEASARDLATAKEAYLRVAQKTRDEKDSFSRVVPPPEATSLQDNAMEFLEKRAIHAETISRFYELAEKEARGEDISESEVRAVMAKGDRERRELPELAKDIRNKKDALVLP